ncbi:RHS repeat domain-containing protein [Gilvimarinus polysaccharolyticus]|uniref:RHS repeat domain-containing protein n=1 Tax=Gilvimarinus polysaccharolyticus TaxID=863921 RepID=UPI0006739F8F|nr:RHS repeat-associated core domain-containing protein [Gilvimarinus polysaccharolyticus]
MDYNDAGQIIQKTEMLSGGTQDTYVYGYDARNRLTEVQKNGDVVEAYGYDANGNRNLRTSTELGVINQAATHNTGDQLAAQGNVTYSYDSNARLSEKLLVDGENSELTTYVYDSVGRLKQVDTPTKSIAYRHNALGNRVAKLVDGVLAEKYLWQDLTTLLATYDGQGNLKQRFEHTLGHTPTSFTQGGQRYFIQTDHLGSPRVITNASGAVVKSIRYDSYGVVIEDSNPTFSIPFGFAGGLYDADTGLVRFGFRDYDPVIGRWTARDPIGFGGGDTNLYGYVLGSPVNWVDPNGLLKRTRNLNENERNQIEKAIKKLKCAGYSQGSENLTRMLNNNQIGVDENLMDGLGALGEASRWFDNFNIVPELFNSENLEYLPQTLAHEYAHLEERKGVPWRIIRNILENFRLLDPEVNADLVSQQVLERINNMKNSGNECECI